MEKKEYELIREIYPEPNEIFSLQVPTLNELKENAIFVIDTNVLLLPYQASSKGLDEISNVYSKLLKQNRVMIPGQVAREFAKNRPEKIKELFQAFNQQKQKISKFLSNRYPILENLTEYQNAKVAETQIETIFRDYHEHLNNILNTIKSWQWNDPVSSIYSSLFNKDSVHNQKIDWDIFIKESQRRYELNIPPGFKDAGKSDGGYGDLLIWHEIIEIAKIKNQNIVFVSGDEKSDWYYKSEGQTLYPRFELLSEFKSKTGKYFTIIKFSNFLELLGAPEEIITEIKSEEIKTTSNRNYKRTINILIENGILKKGDIILLNKNLPFGIVYDDDDLKFKAEITGKLGKSDTVKWLNDNKEYSISFLTNKIFSEILGKDFGATNGNWYWSKNDEILWSLGEDALRDDENFA